MGGVAPGEPARLVKMTDEEYFANPRMSRSDLFTYHKSPALYKAKKDGLIENPSSPALLFGSAFHTMVLEPQHFDERYGIYDGRRSASKSYKQMVETEADAGRQIVLRSEYDQMKKMRVSCLQHELVSTSLDDPEATKEDVIFFDLMGVPCKAKIDLMCRRDIIDLKTSVSADPSDFQSSVTKYGYHWQSYWYKKAAEAIGVKAEFYFAVVAKSEPHESSVVMLSPDYEKIAEDQISAAFEGMSAGSYESRWSNCIVELQPRPWESGKKKSVVFRTPTLECICQWCSDSYVREQGDYDCKRCGMMLCSDDCLDIHECVCDNPLDAEDRQVS